MANPYLERRRKQLNPHGKKSEKRIAKKMGARLTPASGAMRGSKGDAVMQKKQHKFRIENKSTTSLTLTVDIGWLVKIKEEAMASGELPALTLSFVNADGKTNPNVGDWIAMPLWVFETLTEE